MTPIRIFEYLLIISPSEEINRYGWRLKRIFADRYGCTKALRSPHITMGNWRRDDSDEAIIISNIIGFAETVSPFLAQFDGLGNFPPKTIFVNVSNKAPFAEVSKGLKESTQHLLKKDVIFPGTAHLTIARSMNPDQFKLAWSEWKNEEFKASFEVKEMVLLRRSVDGQAHGNYQAIATIPFSGKTTPAKHLGFGF
jgi:2'-5' RNA ligase